MKKIILFILLFVSIISSAQENEEKKYPQDVDKKHELKVNAFNLIAFASLDVSYERLLDANSSFGVALFYNFSDLDNDIVFTKKFSLTPYYRWFFSESTYARGFFVEGFGMLNTYEDEFYFFNSSPQGYSETSFALGISVGGKFVTKSGFSTEIYLGVGRNLIGENNNNNDDFLDNEVVGRFGISLGYRF